MTRSMILLVVVVAMVLAVAVVGVGALEFNGEVVQLTGTQTDDIIWNASNFGGFCYDLGDDACIGTETLTIATGTLEGPNTDRTIETDALTYTTSPIWREYELHKNLGLTVESDYYGGDSGYWTEFWMGERYVAIDDRADKLVKLLVEFNSTDTKTLATGEEWDLGGGFTLTALQTSFEGGMVWLRLCKNGRELDNEVIGTVDADLQNRVYTYTGYFAGEYDIPIFSCYVSAVFRGTCSNLVQVKYVFLIGDTVTDIDTGDGYGAMEAVAAGSSSVTLINKDTTIEIEPDTTATIMDNLSFKTTDNTGAIEFYPHLIRDKPPVLSGGGGFVLDDCWIGSAWNLSENYSIAAKGVDIHGDKARIILLKNDVVVDEALLTEEFKVPVDSDSHYSYVKNGTEIINATLKAAFRGCECDVIELGEVYQRSEVDGSILINNNSHLFKSADLVGILWCLADGYVLTMKDVGVNGEDVWLELSKNGIVVKEKVLNEDYVSMFAYTSGIGGINCVVDRVFRGCEANAVKLMNVSQYSDVNGTALLVGGSHFYKSADLDGMQWELMDGCVLTVKDLDMGCNKAWLELSKDDTVLKEDILESGNLFEYRNGLESVDCVVKAVFRGRSAHVVKLRNVNQYSSTGAQLIDDESKTYATADMVGVMWELCEGYSLTLMDIDIGGAKVWLSLFKDGVSVKDAIVDTDDDSWFTYYNATGVLIFRAYVDAIFRGTDNNVIQLMYVSQYSEIDGSVLIMFEETYKKTLCTPPSIPQSLTIGEPYTNISTDNRQLFSVNVPAGENLLITLEPESPTGTVKLYGGYNRVPTESDYDHIAKNKNFLGNYDLLISPTENRTYCINVYGKDYNITASLVDQYVSDIYPRTLTNSTRDTVHIRGMGFTNGTQVELRNVNLSSIQAQTVVYSSPTMLITHFNLTEVPLGVYDIAVL